MTQTERTLSKLLGETLTSIEGLSLHSPIISFCTQSGRIFEMLVPTDCCNQGRVSDIVGDVTDLLYSPILAASESSSAGEPTCQESCTWTFYTFSTIKGTVTIRWNGESNGYYSEHAEFTEL
jgi:hypothetical protein